MSPREAAAARQNPVTNFLFTYYNGFRPMDLTRWSPGANVGLCVDGDVEAAKELLARADWVCRREYGGSVLELNVSSHQRKWEQLEHAYETLVGTSRRPLVRTCFGIGSV